MDGLQLPLLPGARSLVAAALVAPVSLGLLYLVMLNWAMCRIPAQIRRVAQRPWTKKRLKTQYAKLRRKPITIASTAAQLPPNLDRCYVVTRGSGALPASVLDERDFFAPLRPHADYYGNYPASKAAAERLVCTANSDAMRTGCMRPANTIYGNPTDNTVGGPLTMGLYPVWMHHVVRSFAHGLNCGGAHLDLEAILACPASASSLQAGRPFTVTDPNPPIRFQDVWFMLKTLSITPFRTLSLVPVLMLSLSYAVEWYCLLPVRHPRVLGALLPRITGRVVLLKPPLFSITTHLVATNGDAPRPMADGGFGYKSLIATMEGIVHKVLK
ncbi:hypothetical protein RB594_006241 [Gaeumannomyces avenae]